MQHFVQPNLPNNILRIHYTFSFTRLWDFRAIIKQLSFYLHLSLTRSHLHDNTCANFLISNMWVPELPYRISSPEEALAFLITKLLDELRSDLNQLHKRNETMLNSIVAQLQNFKLQIQLQVVPLSDLYFPKVTSQNIFVSSDISPHLDTVQGIARVFSKTSNLDPHTSRLWYQTQFVTPLSCDIEPDIAKLTSRYIVVSADLDPDLSAGLDHVEVITRVFRGPFLLNSSCRYFEKLTKNEKMSSQLWLRMARYLRYISSRYEFISSSISQKNYAGQKLNNLMWLRMAVECMSKYFNECFYLDNVSFLHCR